jgi:hypothetical protein
VQHLVSYRSRPCSSVRLPRYAVARVRDILLRVSDAVPSRAVVLRSIGEQVLVTPRWRSLSADRETRGATAVRPYEASFAHALRGLAAAGYRVDASRRWVVR